MSLFCPIHVGDRGGKPGEWGREGYRWEVGFLKGWEVGEICINKNNVTIMLNLLQSKKGYREEANKRRTEARKARYLFIYLPAFLDTGLPRGNVHKRD